MVPAAESVSVTMSMSMFELPAPILILADESVQTL